MSPVNSSVVYLITASRTPTPKASSVFNYRENPTSRYGDKK
jgi:hypothetical protein